MAEKKNGYLAAIDVGTNSFHLVVVDVDPSAGRFRILGREKEIVRLGSGSTDMKYLSERAMNRGVETLKRFKIIAGAAGAPIRAVATSAVREALNQDEFVRRVQEEVGIRIEIISGVEEARLIYLGVLQALPVFQKKVLLLDIGGGSTEILIGMRRKVLYDNSLKLGAVRLTQRFFEGGVASAKSIKKCREHILLTIQPVLRILKRHSPGQVVGTSGTLQSIARMVRAKHGTSDAISSLNNFTFTKKEFRSVLADVLDEKYPDARAKMNGLDPHRADIIVAGALILEQFIDAGIISDVTISEYALREGVILDTMEKRTSSYRNHSLNDIRYGSVVHLAKTLGYEKGHSEHVAKLALRLFDETAELHRLGPLEREYLHAAALLHEVGLFLSHSQHHRHSYYLIRNAELLGFTENEKEIIANIARYHRKSHPKYKHEGFRKLRPEDQRIVTRLAGILRIADGLDRTHRSKVRDLQCGASKKKLTITLNAAKRQHIEMEVLGATRKQDLFEQAFGVGITYQMAAKRSWQLAR